MPCFLRSSLHPPRSARVRCNGVELRIVRNRLARQVVQKPAASRELLHDVLDKLLVEALGGRARGRLGVAGKGWRVRKPQANEHRERLGQELDVPVNPLLRSAKPVETAKHEGHVARAVDVLAKGRLKDGALRDAARGAVAGHAIPKRLGQSRVHANTSHLSLFGHRTPLLSCSSRVAADRPLMRGDPWSPADGSSARSLSSAVEAAACLAGKHASQASSDDPGRASSGDEAAAPSATSSELTAPAFPSAWGSPRSSSGTAGPRGPARAGAVTTSPSQSLTTRAGSSRVCSPGLSGGGRPARPLKRGSRK